MQKSTLFIAFLLVAGGSALSLGGIVGSIGSTVGGVVVDVTNTVGGVVNDVNSTINFGADIIAYITQTNTTTTTLKTVYFILSSIVTSLPADLVSDIAKTVETIIAANQDTFTQIAELLEPLEIVVQNFKTSINNIAKALTDSLTVANCVQNDLNDTTTDISTLPQDAITKATECLKPAIDIISQITTIVRLIVELNICNETPDDIFKCIKKPLTDRLFALATALEISIENAPSIVQNCLNEDAVTIVNKASLIANSILNCKKQL